MIFNSYNDKGYRINIVNCRSSMIEDNAIARNLRSRWPNELAEVSDVMLVNTYDEFALSDMWGNNDERFLEYLALCD